MEHEKKSPRKMFEKFYGKPFEQITPEDIGQGEEIDWGPDVGAERLELYDEVNETVDSNKDVSSLFGSSDSTIDGLEIQKKLREEWDEREAAIKKLLNEGLKE